ncbi:unnamed protein product [Mytilus edulis]|uniref:Uncharacterized protein n=1 Tax=Mytilus edulis TaxID=6550 RepID=A0A8S3R1V2_MYTED|nr:unnamed protein product [Mytilus edulis]
MEARLGFFLLLLVTVLQVVVESGYIGCYQDDSTRILPKAVLKDKGMTVQKCQQFCGKKGFKFAGVEYGYECFCGNVLRKCRKRKESDCKMPCSGNKRQTCGGPWRISIYTSKPSNCKGKCHKNGICKRGRCRCKRGYTGDGINACSKLGYLGCYRDDSTRILSKAILQDKGMTVQKCQQFCGKKGFKFAGVEYGYECFCGNVLRKYRKRKESDCKTPCSGNKRQTCGGPWRISIYTGKPSNCKGKCHKNGICKRGRCRCKRGYTGDGINACSKLGYIGCYWDHSTRILSKAKLQDKGKPSNCKGKCHKNGICKRGRCRCNRGYTGDGINACSICPLGWKSYGSSCYFFSQTTATWNDAKRKCITKNSMLAEVVSYGERDFLRKQASKYAETFWLGGTDSKHEGSWIWATSQSNFIVTGWHTRLVKEPNNQGGNEHCINIHKKLDFEWNDDRCWNSYRYICEKLLV